MKDDRIPEQGMYWQMVEMDHNAKQTPGIPRKNWTGYISQDLKTIGEILNNCNQWKIIVWPNVSMILDDLSLRLSQSC